MNNMSYLVLSSHDEVLHDDSTWPGIHNAMAIYNMVEIFNS